VFIRDLKDISSDVSDYFMAQVYMYNCLLMLISYSFTVF
jgi:hypothetical protein